jgi:glycosyltransferase involved in cell wall biosynthesis
MDPTVSIITIAYNSSATIRQTIESVLNQTYIPIEYAIIDGLSSDNTVSIAAEYETAFAEKGIKYFIISEKDNGIYDAMNKGISMSNGEIVGMINSDDWYEIDALEAIVQEYRNNKYDYLYGDIKIINGKRKRIKRSRYRKHYVTSRDWNHPTCFVARRIYNKMQYSNISLYDDFDLYLRVRNDKYRIVVLNRVLANFRFGGVSNRKNIKSLIDRTFQRYGIYRQNNYSRCYIVECILTETVKYLFA